MTTWVLLRGLAREARHWGPFPGILQAQLPPGQRVLAIDLPGNGSRWRERSPATLAGLVDAARDEARARGAQPPYVLLALSLGGMVALEWAARAPAQVAACVLVNSSMGAFSPWWERLRPGCYGQVLRWLAATTPRDRERIVHAMTSAHPPVPQVIAQWVAYAQERPVSVGNVARQLAAAARYSAPARVSVPTLVLASRGDRLVAPECSRRMAEAWRLPLREHPHAGHDLPLDDPLWVALQVATWRALRA